jgi:hypothetical protein
VGDLRIKADSVTLPLRRGHEEAQAFQFQSNAAQRIKRIWACNRELHADSHYPVAVQSWVEDHTWVGRTLKQ